MLHAHHTWLLHAHYWLLWHTPHHAWLLHAHYWLLHAHAHNWLLHAHTHDWLAHHSWLLHSHHHLRGHHWLLVAHAHNLLCRGKLDLSLKIVGHLIWVYAMSGSIWCFRWGPGTFQVQLAGLFALVMDREPVVEASIDAQSAKFDDCLANEVASCHVLVIHRDIHVIANVLHIDIEHLVPLWCLTSALKRSCA